MIFVVSGLVVVGLADIVFGTSAKDDVNAVITGLFILLIILRLKINLFYRRSIDRDGADHRRNSNGLRTEIYHQIRCAAIARCWT